MVSRKVYEARAEHHRARAETAVSDNVRWLYEDMARHYEQLLKRGAYDADARAKD